MNRPASATKSKSKTEQTPRAFGFRMPAEWEHHEATWLSWPHELTDWPGKFAPIPWVYAEIARHLSRVERVRILVNDREAENRARTVLKKNHVELDAIDFLRVPTDRGWIRDFGPIFVRTQAGNANKEVAATHWLFNAWAKYDNFKRDSIAFAIANRKLNHHVWQPVQNGARVVLEGGSIEVNGRGTMLTTEECLLSDVQARNPAMSRGQIEDTFREYLGVTNVLWLKNGIAGDDTHGHVDDLARFVNPTTVVTVVEENKSDANFAPLQENLALLKNMRDQDGHSLCIETLPMPAPVYFKGQRLPASYANFYIANKTVLVPLFNDANDRVALDTLAKLFQDREVIGIGCRDLVLGLGTIHCMTQQEPTAGA